MNDPNLLAISVTAFLAVFVLLTVLSVIITIINKVFPYQSEESEYDPILAAISGTVSNLYPNSKITHIEEVK